MSRRRGLSEDSEEEVWVLNRNIRMLDAERMHSISSFYGDPHDTSSGSSDTDSWISDVVPTEGALFSDKFLATLQRTFRQKRRDALPTVLEVIVPILFVIGVVILWVALRETNHPERNFVGTDSASYTEEFFAEELCYNNRDNPIPKLPSCESLPVADCEGDESSLPVKGLCAGKSVKLGSVLGIFLNSLLGPTSLVPSLDNIIIHQWVARKLGNQGKADGLSTLSNVGLASKTRADAIRCSGKLLFAPRKNIPPGLINFMTSRSQYLQLAGYEIFDSMETATDYIRVANDSVWAIVEIIAFKREQFDVDLHMRASALPPLHQVEDLGYPGGYSFDRADMYMVSGFTSLQRLLYEHYLTSVYNYPNINAIVPYLTSIGSREFQRNVLLESAATLTAFILVLSFLYPTTSLTKKIVLEKELRIRESMLIMGLSNTALYLTWFVVYALQYLFVCLVMVFIIKFTFAPHSDPYIVFVLFYLFALTTIPLSALMASFFSKARLASMLAPLIYFVLAVPIFAITSSYWSISMVASCLSPTAFSVALINILLYETGGGFAATAMTSTDVQPATYLLYVMLVVDFVLYFLLVLYFDAVMPKEWGTTKSPFFCIVDPIRALMRCCNSGDALGSTADGRQLEDGRADDGVFEEVEDVEPAVEMRGLRKSYKRNGKSFLAVNNLSWTLARNNISVLLGHNGAGKTTVMNMLTGMIEPDGGDGYLFGYSVRQQLSQARQLIGYCPQHNILWPELTCREHLEFFGKIKGLKGKELEASVFNMLGEVDLLEKVDQPSKSLSGGQKRKLSVSIAFVSSSQLVFLDEPTAGMDVGARRHTWELLRRMSDTHSILLTTHYMDEADLLGHRIGIMSQGRLKCSGSSMFLKARLGVGYDLSIALEPEADEEDVYDMVVSFVPTAECVGNNGYNLIFYLPTEEVDRFPLLLTSVEAVGESLGVRGYSLSATTLEEVFLKVAAQDVLSTKPCVMDSGVGSCALEWDMDTIWGCEYLISKTGSQFSAMMAKRLWNSLRDRRMQCFQVVCPVVCILLAMVFTLVEFRTFGSREYTMAMFQRGTEMEISNCRNYFGDITSGAVTPDDTTVYDRNFLSSENMSWYAVDTWMSHTKPRYTSIFCNDTHIPSFEYNASPTILMYNTSAYHSAALVLNQLYEFILQQVTNDPLRRLKTRSSPMPLSQSDKATKSASQTILIGAIILIPFTFLPSNTVAWIVKERECRARHIQDIAGLNFYIYWLTNFLFDVTAFLITLALVMLIFVIFGRKEFVGSDTFGPTTIMFVVYGFTSTVAAYAISYLFKEHSSAQTIVMGISFVSGFMLVMMVFILSLVEKTRDASDKIRWGFRLVPGYAVGECIINLAMLPQKKLAGEVASPWDMDIIGWSCVYMGLEFPFFVLLTLLIDHPKRRALSHKQNYFRNDPVEDVEEEDTDVEDERLAVCQMEAEGVNNDIVRMVNLRKVYPNGKVAVRNLTFSVLPGEKFGFLGTNGAGKTTAISVLCQEIGPTSGSASICGYDIMNERPEALQCIGYCPQFDATLDLLTVEEHLYLYAGVRAIRQDQRREVVNQLMALCGIYEYRSTTARALSGGNRRKLSVAISLIGSPRVLLLDEPSAGMDPVARRGLWNAIREVSRHCAIVLTTHHLEEVEALADTVAIMADGALRCIGDKVHLKNKYGTGFEMSIRIADKKLVDSVMAFVESSFPDAQFNEFKGQMLVYALPPTIQLSAAFTILQSNKNALGITDYSVSQTSLEQVFLRISEDQEERDAASTFGDHVNENRGF